MFASHGAFKGSDSFSNPIFMKLRLLLSFILLNTFGYTFGQVTLTNALPTATVDFSASMQTTVGTSPSSVYTGAGFAPAPTAAGKLNSNAWEVKGWSFGDLLFGGTQPVDDFGRGSVGTGVVTPGMYAYTNFPGTTTNPMLLIQTGAGDFAPGTLTLKIKNSGTTKINQLNISYNLFVQNDESGSTSFNFSHSADNVAFTNEASLNYTSPELPDAFQWNNVAGISPSRMLTINGLDIDPNEFYYIRWTAADVVVSGARDEIGLDDISIGAVYGSPAPEINVTSYGNNLLSGDVTPTVAKGTDFAPVGAPISTLNTAHIITYYVNNIGGLPLNISGITITGPQAADFTFFGPIPSGNIAPGGSVGLSVVFDPSDGGLRQARINIANNDANENPYFFDIQGYGVIPIPDIRVNGGPTGSIGIVTGGSLVPKLTNNTLFSNQPVGGAGEIKGWEIRNDCPQNAPLLLTDPSPYVTISGANPADFTLMTYPVNGSILPGAKRAFTIKFSPTAIGIRTALVSIANNDPDVSGAEIESPFVFMIQGTGISPEIDITGNTQPIESGSVTPSLVNHTFFDYLNVSTGSIDRTYTIKNNGNAALTIGALTLTGAQASDFSIITNPAATLAVAASTTFTIRFDPSASGPRTATVNLINSDINESPYTFVIGGYGVDYVPCAFGALETIAIQNFDTTQAPPIWAYTATGTTALAAGTGYAQASESDTTPRFLGTRSLQVINGTGVVTMNNIVTTGYSDLELNIKLASLATTAAEGADATDIVKVAISNNGGPWSDEIQVQGNTNSKWSFASGTGIATSVYDGNAVATVFNSGAGYVTTTGYGSISLTGLPKSANLSVRITITNNSASEIWAIDNVTLFGRKPITATWNGGWSPSAPGATTKAVIVGAYNTLVNGNITACQCEIRSGAAVTISNGNYFDVGGELDNSGTLVVESGGSLIQHNDLSKNSGTVRVERNTTTMKAYDYTYWSSPVDSQTLFGFSPATRFDKYFSYDPVIGNWVPHYNGATVMQPAVGYIIRAPYDFTAAGAIFPGKFNGIPNNGYIQTPIKIGVDNMNLIGNPYPSAINAISFLSNPANVAVVEGTIYLWTHNSAISNHVYNADDYAVYCYTGPVATRASITTGLGNTTTPTGSIASGQGFFIKGLQNNSQVTFNNSMRVVTGNNGFFKQNDAAANDIASRIEQSEKNRFWLNFTNAEGAFKQILVGYVEEATNGIDRGYDGEAIGGNPFVDFYSTVSDVKLAIQGRALPFVENDKVTLGYTSTIEGTFEIAIDSTDGFMRSQNIYLEDKLLNIIHDLKQSAYSFTTETGTFNERFEVRYTNENTLNTAGFDAIQNQVFVSVNNQQIHISSQLQNIQSVAVYDVLGRKVYETKKAGKKSLSIDKPVAAQQTLILKIILENGQVTTKKVTL